MDDIIKKRAIMIISDIIKESDGDIIVKVEGRNPNDDCDCLVEEYYHGRLDGVPDELKSAEVLSTGWLLGAKCHSIEIAYQQKEDL